MKYEKEIKALNEALNDLIYVLINNETHIPDRMLLETKTEHLKINADIKLDVELTKKGERIFAPI